MVKPFCDQAESVTFIKEPLDPVFTDSTEQEKSPFFYWIKPIVQADDGNEAVDTAPHVSSTGDQKYASDRNVTSEHDSMPQSGGLKEVVLHPNTDQYLVSLF